MGPHWKPRLIGFLVLSVVTVLMSSCTSTVPLKGSVDNPPRIDKLPLAVGVYYSPEFRAHEDVRTHGGFELIFPSGQASVSLFNQIFPLVFESVAPVSDRPPLSAGKPKIAAVIEPRIEGFEVAHPMGFSGSTVEITYRFTLYSPEGTRFASWTVVGVGSRDFGFKSKPGGLQADAADRAIDQAATKFLTGFRDVPGVRRWLRRVGVPEAR